MEVSPIEGAVGQRQHDDDITPSAVSDVGSHSMTSSSVGGAQSSTFPSLLRKCRCSRPLKELLFSKHSFFKLLLETSFSLEFQDNVEESGAGYYVFTTTGSTYDIGQLLVWLETVERDLVRDPIQLTASSAFVEFWTADRKLSLSTTTDLDADAASISSALSSQEANQIVAPNVLTNVTTSSTEQNSSQDVEARQSPSPSDSDQLSKRQDNDAVVSNGLSTETVPAGVSEGQKINGTCCWNFFIPLAGHDFFLNDGAVRQKQLEKKHGLKRFHLGTRSPVNRRCYVKIIGREEQLLNAHEEIFRVLINNGMPMNEHDSIKAPRHLLLGSPVVNMPSPLNQSSSENDEIIMPVLVPTPQLLERLHGDFSPLLNDIAKQTSTVIVINKPTSEIIIRGSPLNVTAAQQVVNRFVERNV